MKNVVVTGAASGIGFQIANDFAKSGYNVIALDKYHCSFEQENITFIKIDLRDSSQVEIAFKQVELLFGSADILINNPGITLKHDALYDTSVEDFDDILSMSLRGAYLCATEFAKINSEATFGRIINISPSGFDHSEANYQAYDTSQGAIISLTNSLCVSLHNTAITVNAITPGWIKNENYHGTIEGNVQGDFSKRMGKPKDISNVCLFLCKDKSSFINGANIVVDGGFSKRNH